jgi:hypothetical protein
MSTLLRKIPPMLVFGAAVTLASPVLAQGWGGGHGGYGYGAYPSEARHQAYDHGYRKGLDHGRDDAKDRRSYDYRRDKDYRKSDDGYKGRYGGREWYANEFRRGYLAGYERGYKEYAARYDNGRYRNDGYDRDGGHDRNSGPYANDGRYGRPYPRAVANAGYSRGYNDGLQKGSDDARHRRTYDLNRQSWYRSADRGYDRDYGSRYDYQASYRQGFERGYADGYRERY